MDKEDEIRKLFEGFITRARELIGGLSAERMIAESAINPILAKSLGFHDFESLARFYVYQRIGRSLVTSFGMRMEKTGENNRRWGQRQVVGCCEGD